MYYLQALQPERLWHDVGNNYFNMELHKKTESENHFFWSEKMQCSIFLAVLSCPNHFAFCEPQFSDLSNGGDDVGGNGEDLLTISPAMRFE